MGGGPSGRPFPSHGLIRRSSNAAYSLILSHYRPDGIHGIAPGAAAVPGEGKGGTASSAVYVYVVCYMGHSHATLLLRYHPFHPRPALS